MKYKVLPLSFFLLFSLCQAFSETKIILNDADQAILDFKESKFLQLDTISLPPELIKIEDEIKQNLIDVIIHSRTHTPVFSQKREDGYNESYKKFHGLKVKISSLPDAPDFYHLHLFYYNWTTNKFDKKLTKKISKYNVLNESRFGLFELLLGKKFVKDHKDELEKQNFDRIQDVRQAVTIQKKKEKNEKKLKKEKEIDKEIEKEVKKKINY